MPVLRDARVLPCSFFGLPKSERLCKNFEGRECRKVLTKYAELHTDLYERCSLVKSNPEPMSAVPPRAPENQPGCKALLFNR